MKEVLQKIFPQPGLTFNGRGGAEVNGLPKGTVPQNCEILASGLVKHLTERREHYLVRVDDVMVYLRVCTAAENSGYDEFVYARSFATTPAEQADLDQYARSSIASLCG